MKREYVSKRGRTTNQSTKFQNLKVAWLTVLIISIFNKPSCKLLELFNKKLRKFFTISGLRKISALAGLRKFQKSGLRKFLNCLDLENFSIAELRDFSIQGKIGKKT